MNRIDIATITFFTGLTCATLVGIFSNLYHKRKKIDSFRIVETDMLIILENNPFTNVLSSVSYFFILSLFSFFIATNQFNLYIELGVIYLACLLLTGWNFVKKKKYKIIIEKESKEIVIKTKRYKLEDTAIITSLNKSWPSDDLSSYGLYLKDQNGKYVLIYGYSVFRDIENLRNRLLDRINGLQ